MPKAHMTNHTILLLPLAFQNGPQHSSDDDDGSHIDSSDDGDCYDLPKGLFLQLLRERKMLHLPLPVLQGCPCPS